MSHDTLTEASQEAGAIQSEEVGQPVALYKKMEPEWDEIHDVLEGTEAMREAREKYLPKFPRESPAKYQRRIDQSFLFNGLESAVERVVSKPFARQVALVNDEGLPDYLVGWEKNIDGAGTTLHDFLRKDFETAVPYGMAHVFVDDSQDAPLTAADERGRPAPEPNLVAPQNMIGWKEDERGKLTEIRMREERMESVGTYGQEAVEYIRVFRAAQNGERGTWELWRKEKDSSTSTDNYSRHDSGTHTYPDGIPLHTIYTKRRGRMYARSAFRALLKLNIQHWQKQSDHDNWMSILRTVAFFLAGFTDEEMDDDLDELVISPEATIKTTNDKAKAEIIEHTGKAYEASSDDIRRNEERQEQLGLQPFINKHQDATATGQMIDEDRKTSDVKAWVSALKTHARAIYEIGAKWRGQELPEDFGVDIYDEFTAPVKDNQDFEHLQKMRDRGDLSRETILSESVRYNLLPDTLDPVEELRRVEKEEGQALERAAAFADITGVGKNDDDEGEGEGRGEAA